MASGSTGAKVAPEVTPLIPGNQDNWRLLIVAERFQRNERDIFLAHARRLADHMARQAPFNHSSIRGTFQIYACFTPTKPEGMFECRDQGVRRYYGKPDLVRKYLSRHQDARPELKRRSNDVVLVLMNFVKRGGAGEQGNDNIAWSTPVHWIENGIKTEDWCDVTLHELGHAFDLDDEYDAEWPDAPDIPLKANVAKSSNPDSAPWRDMFDALPPTTLAAQDLPLGQADLERYGQVKVGLFQGARYSATKYWRSALRCKMRSTPDPFCHVCQARIRKVIQSNG
jgi:hypothetical protein